MNHIQVGNLNVNDNSVDGTKPPQIGDIITAADGHPVRQIDDIIINYIESQKSVGDNIKITVNRKGQITDLTATFAS